MLPAHLKRYVVEQDYSRYTPVDQEVWRYCMRQLKDFLSRHAHPCYVEGLSKTGIEIDRIPEISRMSEKLEKFGWSAVPVSGFIPPAAFMELQALGFLPIASDMRTIDHIEYTPAPDIVHEAAGHAPILINDEFAAYLKSYAQVARKAILSKEDMDQYEAIRLLSDLKEDPSSSVADVLAAEESLKNLSITHLSEGAYLSRMNWWTAEYGLIGPLGNPKLYGAGLLSSVGESRACLDPKVTKIPFSIDCINYAYDITEQQPQLFVTPDFGTLSEVLEQLAARMAFRLGGVEGLLKAQLAETVNTVELNSGVQIGGRLKRFLAHGSREVAYLQFEGPTQLGFTGAELDGHGSSYHKEGFGSPVGFVEGAAKCLSQMSASELEAFGIRAGARIELKYKTGAHVRGEVIGVTWSPERRPLLISFKNCTVTREGQTLFEPAWGTYDMAVGSSVVSVYGGPVDRLTFGESHDFAAKVIPRKQWPADVQYKHKLFAEVRSIRSEPSVDRIQRVLEQLESSFPHEWLLRLALYEISRAAKADELVARLEAELRNIGANDQKARQQIQEGLRLVP